MPTELGSDTSRVHRRRPNVTRLVPPVELDRKQHVGGLGAAVGNELLVGRVLKVRICKINVRIAVAGGGDIDQPAAKLFRQGQAIHFLTAALSPDGKLLLFRRQGEKTRYDVWLLPLEQAESGGKAEPRVFVQTPFNEGIAKFSPDGRWVAYTSDESGQNEVYVAPFPGPGGKRQISSGGGGYPLWRRDGKELFFASRDQQLMAAEVNIGNGTLEVEKVQKLFEGVISGSNSFDVSADGQKFLVVDDSVASSSPLTLVQNWPASLRK